MSEIFSDGLTNKRRDFPDFYLHPTKGCVKISLGSIEITV